MNFLLFGQSNMAGADAIAPDPWIEVDSDRRSSVYHYTDLGLPHRQVVKSPLRPISAKTSGCPEGAPMHGPEIGFARGLQAQMPDDYVLVKVTDNIAPSEKSFLWGLDERFGKHMLQFYHEVTASAHAKAPPSAVLMAQGIDEALSELRCSQYKENLSGLITGIRDHFELPSLPFIIGESIHSPFADREQMTFVREVQRQASLELPKVGFIPTADLRPYVCGHHLSSASQLEFGQRFATEFLRLVI